MRRRYHHTARPASAVHFRPYSKGEILAILKKAETLDAWSKKFGCRMGLIGDSGMKVLRALLYGFMDWKTGACFPRIRAIMAKTRYARSTVCEALRRLERVGIVQRINRRQWKTIWRNGGSFKAEVQTSNAYLFSPPHPDARTLPVCKRARPGAKQLTLGIVGSVKGTLSMGVSGSGERTRRSPIDISRPSRDLAGALARLEAGVKRGFQGRKAAEMAIGGTLSGGIVS